MKVLPTPNLPKETNIDLTKQGLIWCPYIIEVTFTMINGDVVWYKNKWKNFLLKFKRLFVKLNYIINTKGVYNKVINKNYYSQIKVEL